MVEREFLTLAVWDQLDPAAAEHVGWAVAGGLPAGWRFDRVEQRESPFWRRPVAVFAHGSDEYVLIPGGPARLGWDRGDRADIPDEWVTDAAEQMAGCYDWQDFDLWDHFDRQLSPAREVTLVPVLMELAARRKGEPTDGFRRPTDDEWEYAYSGGGVRLADWLAHAMKARWPTHTLPNPFGLNFIQSQQEGGYRLQIEWCEEPNTFRGGDGGCQECTGIEGVGIAMTGAPQYRPDEIPADTRHWYPHRRVFPLPAGMLG